jgi:hypothetical protein
MAPKARGREGGCDATRLLGVRERTFRRYIDRYAAEELEELIDERLSQVSHRAGAGGCSIGFEGGVPQPLRGLERQALPRM